MNKHKSTHYAELNEQPNMLGQNPNWVNFNLTFWLLRMENRFYIWWGFNEEWTESGETNMQSSIYTVTVSETPLSDLILWILNIIYSLVQHPHKVDEREFAGEIKNKGQIVLHRKKEDYWRIMMFFSPQNKNFKKKYLGHHTCQH